MKKRFPIFWFVMIIAALLAVAYHFLFRAQETVFSDGILSRISGTGQLARPARPLNKEELVLTVDDQFNRAKMSPGTKIEPTDAQLDSSLPAFAAYAAQVIYHVAGIASDSTNVPTGPELDRLGREIAAMQQGASRWDAKTRNGSEESVTVRNISAWADMLNRCAMGNWLVLSSYEPGKPSNDHQDVVTLATTLENITLEGTNLHALFHLEPFQGMQPLARYWLDDVSEIRAFSSEHPGFEQRARLDRLIVLHSDAALPAVLRQYAASVFMAELPLPHRLADLEAEIVRATQCQTNPVYADLSQFFNKRIPRLKAIAEVFRLSVQAPRPDLITKLETLADPTCPSEVELANAFKQFQQSLAEAQKAEASQRGFDAQELQLLIEKWSHSADQGGFFEGLSEYSQKQLKPYKALADLLQAAAGESGASTSQWRDFEECRARYFKEAPAVWRELFHHLRRSYFPLAADTNALVLEAQELNDPGEVAWAKTILEFLRDRDTLQKSVTRFEQLENVEVKNGDLAYIPEIMENREAAGYLTVLKQVRDAVRDVAKAEDAMPDATLDDEDANIYATTASRLSEAYAHLREIIRSAPGQPWETMVEDHCRPWETALAEYAARESDNDTAETQVKEWSRQLANSAQGHDSKLSEFLAAARFQKVSFRYTEELPAFVEEQQRFAAQLEELAGRLNQDGMAKIGRLHARIAGAASAYGNLWKASGFIQEYINNTSVPKSAAWRENWNNADLAWWGRRRSKNEPARYFKDMVALWNAKYAWPAWKNEYPDSQAVWINKALPGQEFQEACAEIANLKGTMLTDLGVSLRAGLDTEFGAFEEAQQLEGAGNWAAALRAYAVIRPKTIRGELFKEARLARLEFLTTEHSYSVPADFQFDIHSEWADDRWTGGKTALGVGLTLKGFCVVNGATTNKIELHRPTLHDSKTDPGLNLEITLKEPIRFKWAGGSSVKCSFYAFRGMLSPKLLRAVQFSDARALFQFARAIGVTPGQMGFPYIEPDTVIVGKINPNDRPRTREGVETQIDKATNVLEGAIDSLTR